MMAPLLMGYSRAWTPAYTSGSVSARPGSLTPVFLPAARMTSTSSAVYEDADDVTKA